MDGDTVGGGQGGHGRKRVGVAGWNVPGYTELKTMGSGGFGDVVLARHDASGTLVAVKYLRGALLADPKWAWLFRFEAQVLATLDDPNVVRLYEYVESSSGAAIVMELVNGVSLREILIHQGGTFPEAALVVLQGSLLGLAAAHRRGIVHRDYKPENVLVSGGGVSKLTDFGIAARAGAGPVAAGSLMYAPPEQFTGAAASPAGDVYAATATFYECLTGRPPFTGDSAARLLYRHQTAPVPLEAVPGPLRPLVAAGMAKEPGNRPADAAAFAAALDTIAARAYGPDWAERGRSYLGEAALLLAALWPSGPPAAGQGSAVERVTLSRKAGQKSQGSRHPWHLRHLWHQRHLRYFRVATAVVAASAVVGAGTALAATRGSSPPAETQTTPTQTQATPTQTRATPAQTHATSAQARITPAQTQTTPAQTQTTPAQTQTTPAQTQSTPAVAAPDPPGSVIAVATSQYAIRVTWADASTDVTGFHIDNGCPVGSCGPGGSLTQTTGLVESATFGVTPGTYQCFRVQAFNSGGASPWSKNGCASTPGLTVSGTDEWTDTGVTVAAGDAVGLTASGQVNLPTESVGPAGISSCTAQNFVSGLTYPAPGLPCWSLIARIGNGTPFEVGSSALVTVGSGGVLYLGIDGDAFAGNSGTWTVNIKLGGLPPLP